MKQEEIRQKLIEGTIHVIARDGLDKSTTKQIGIFTGINEAYIYRNFVDKEDMFSKAFDKMDKELLEETIQRIDIIYSQSMEYEMRWRLYFFAIWKLLLEDRDECIAYVRYYYSPYFTKNSYESHRKRFKPLVDRFREAFKDEADVWMILHHILNVMLDFAVKLHNHEIPDNYDYDDYSEHVFRVVYRSIEQYFRKSKESDL